MSFSFTHAQEISPADYYTLIENAESEAKKHDMIGGNISNYIIQQLGMNSENLKLEAELNTEHEQNVSRLIWISRAHHLL